MKERKIFPQRNARKIGQNTIHRGQNNLEGGGGYLPGVINTPSLGRLPSIVVRFKATKRVVELGVGAHVLLSGMHGGHP